MTRVRRVVPHFVLRWEPAAVGAVVRGPDEVGAEAECR